MSAEPLHLAAELTVGTGEVRDAARRIAPYLAPSPLVSSETLNETLGCQVYCKAEGLQPTGSFKVRGAYNRLLQLSDDERACGIIAWSAGNHGQALGFVGRKLGISVMVVAPSDAPATKLQRMEQLGIELVLYDRLTESREAIGCAIAETTGRVIVPPYDDPDIIAGQGTLALEAAEQLAARDVHPDCFVSCVGGGGLIAGCALGFGDRPEKPKVVSAEPEFYDDTKRSLEAGVRVQNDLDRPCISDALMTVEPGVLTFPLNQNLIHHSFAVTETSVCKAVRAAFDHLRLVVEPGGAVALAAIFENRDWFEGQSVIVTLSGANVDTTTFTDIITGARP